MTKKSKKSGPAPASLATLQATASVRGPEELFCCVCKEFPFYKDESGAWYCSQDWYAMQKAGQVGSAPVESRSLLAPPGAQGEGYEVLTQPK